MSCWSVSDLKETHDVLGAASVFAEALLLRSVSIVMIALLMTGILTKLGRKEGKEHLFSPFGIIIALVIAAAAVAVVIFVAKDFLLVFSGKNCSIGETRADYDKGTGNLS